MFVLCTCAYPVLGARKIIVIVAACMIDNFTSEIKATWQYLKKKVFTWNIGRGGMDKANPQPNCINYGEGKYNNSYAV